jgi:hypothetical protein
VATLCSIAGVAAVTRGAAAQPPPESPAAETQVTAAADPRSDAAWQLYHDAFAALMRGESARARELASALLRDYPDHPATRLVRSAHLGLAPGAIDDGAAQRAAGETASRGARAELALFQSLHGIALGIEACVVFKCDSGEAYLGLALAGGAVGAIIPLNLGGLTSGDRALLNSGTVWGAVNASLVLFAMSDPDAQTAGLTLIGGQTTGLALGSALTRLHPTAGQVGLANSGGQWLGVVSALTMVAAGVHASDREEALALLVSVDTGLVGGAYLASRLPRISRAQTLVIDAGGIVGGVAGSGLAIIVSGHADERPTSGFAAAGAVIGLAAAAYFTRDWADSDASSVHGYLAPPAHGHGGVAGIGFQW